MRTLILCAFLLACGDDDSTPIDAGTDAALDAETDSGTDAAVDAFDAGEEGPVTAFANVGDSNEGIATGVNAAGEPVLFVSVLEGPIIEVGVDGSVSTLATLDSPLGIAVRDDGNLVVCVNGGLVDLALDGTATPLVETTEENPIELSNYVVIAPDGSIVFSDSMGDRVYRTQADGSTIEVVTDTIEYPNGLAFDGNRLLVASYDGNAVYGADFTDGTFGEFTIEIPEVDFVDGVVVGTDATYLVTSTDGVLEVRDGVVTPLIEPRAIFLPANGTFGSTGFDPNTLFVSSLGGPMIYAIDLEAP